MFIRVIRAGCLAGLVMVVTAVDAQQSPVTSASDDLDALAEELVRLRGEVESLNSELNRLQEQHRSEMSSLAAQKGDLQATRRRESLRIEKLETDLAENRERAEQAGVTGEALVPVATDAIAALRAHIESSLPFKRKERLDALAEIEGQLASGALAPPRAVNRLWGFYEDELRLTRENGLYSQVIPLEGERILADVAKLGTVTLYFRTKDGEVGQVARAGDDWDFVVIDDSAGRKRIETLFDSLRKQIRTGYFTLPNASIRLENES